MAGAQAVAPTGPGSVSGIGGTFSADPFTGTGRFQVPLPTPPSHNGLAPGLGLTYSSGAGSGVCGVGWSFTAPAVTRRTGKGIPTFTDSDVFLLSGEELVPIGDGEYVRRTEGAFARVRRVRDGSDDFWAVTERDGTRRLFGRHPGHRDGDRDTPVTWHLSEIRDTNDNRVVFGYRYNTIDRRAYVTGATWGPFRLQLQFERRPDILRTARSGVLLSMSQRLRSASVQVRHRDSGRYLTFDRFSLRYRLSPITGLSLLDTIVRTGIDAAGNSRDLPVVRFSYATPTPPGPLDITGHGGRSLADADSQLVDMNGNGLPDLLQSNGNGWLLRTNRGDGSFAPPVPVAGPAARLSDPGVLLSDLDGSGFPDLVTPQGWYPHTGNGFGPFRPFPTRPVDDLTSADIRLVDLDGDGIADLLHIDGSFVRWHPASGTGFLRPVIRPLAGARLPLLTDRWTRLADMVGDGLADLVRLSRGSIEIHQNLGRGVFAPARLLALPDRLPADVEPEQMMLADCTGTGAADLVVRLGHRTWIYVNGCGQSLKPRLEIRTRALGAGGIAQPVDLLGNGGMSLLFTEHGDRHAWTLYPLFTATRPDVLTGIDNGLGRLTEIRYESALLHAARDTAAGRPWRYPQPRAVPVVAAMVRTDTSTGSKVGVRFDYHEGYHDAQEREFCGFAIVEQRDTERDAPCSGAATSRTVTFHHLGNGDSFTDRWTPVPAAMPPDKVPPHSGACRALRGAVIREEIYGDDGSTVAGRPYRVMHRAYTVVPVVGPAAGDPPAFSPQPTSQVTVLTERTAHARVTRSETTFDDLGRSVEVRTIAEARTLTDCAPGTGQEMAISTVTRHRYVERRVPDPPDYDAAYEPAYILDRPSSWTCSEMDPAGTERLTGEELLFYDGAAFTGLGHPESGSAAAVKRGLLSCRLRLVTTDAQLDGYYADAADARSTMAEMGGYLRIADRWYAQLDRTEHDGPGNSVMTLDPMSRSSRCEYDPEDQLFPVRLTDCAGLATDILLGELRFQVDSWADARGNVTSYTYDPAGFVTTVTQQGRSIDGEWEGDPPSHPTEEHEVDFSVPMRIATRRRLERRGAQLLSVRHLDGAGQTVEVALSAEPDPDHPDRPRFRISGRSDRDHKGQLIRSYPPAFADTAELTGDVDRGLAITTTFDPLGRPVLVRFPDGSTARSEYHPWRTTTWDRDDTAGALDPLDSRYGPVLPLMIDLVDTPVTSHLDPAGRPTAVEHAGQRCRRRFDTEDAVTAAWDARDAAAPTWQLHRDLLGRRLRLSHPSSGEDELVVLDASGAPIWSRDGTGTVVRLFYDDAGRPVRETSDAGTGSVLRHECRYGDLTGDQREIGRVIETSDAAGVSRLTYDWRGGVTTTVRQFWLTGHPVGRWDDVGAPLWTDPTADGPLPGVLISLDGLEEPGTLSELIRYDDRGRPVVARYSGGLEIRERYDTSAHPVALDIVTGSGADPVPLVSSFERDAAERVTCIRYGNGVVTTRLFDPATERLIRITTTSPGGVLGDVEILTTPAGLPMLLLDRTEPGDRAPGVVTATRRFRYDTQSRLIGASGTAHESAVVGADALPESAPSPEHYGPYETTYDYDAAGNVTLSTEYDPGPLQYDPQRPDQFLGRASQDPAGRYAYDGAGRAIATASVPRLVYDHRGCLRYAEAAEGQVHLRSGDGQRPELRIARDGLAITLTARLGPLEYVAVADEGRRTAELILRVGADASGGLVRHVLTAPATAEVSYTHGDQLGSVAEVTSAGGELTDQESFFPYGRSSDRRSDRVGPRYLALDREPVSGLYLTGPRLYDPAVGRFLQPDPAGPNRPDWSPYSYANACPMKVTDPSGNAPVPPLLAFAGWLATEPDPATGERPPVDHTTREWLEWGAYKALELFVSPSVDVSNAPTGESVDVNGDEWGMAMGLLGVAGMARSGLTILARTAAPGAVGLLASGASTSASLAQLEMAASGATAPAYSMLTRFYRYVVRPPMQYRTVRDTTRTALGWADTTSGQISINLPAIAAQARALRMGAVDVAWETVRHELFHQATTWATWAVNKTQARHAWVAARGRGFFYEEFIAETLGRGTTTGVADFVFSYRNLTFSAADFARDIAWAKSAAVKWGAIGAGTVHASAVGTAMSLSTAIGAREAYEYLFPPLPPITVLPPITLP